MVVASEKPTIASKDSAQEPSASLSARQLERQPWWQAILQSLLVAVLAIAACETFLNAAGVGMEEILQPDPQLGTRHIPSKKVVWRMEGFSSDHFSSTGLRDIEHSVSKPAGTFRIALLGDSATEALQVPFDTTYGARLQHLFAKQGMRTEAINFGCSSFSTGQEVLQFEQEAAKYKPDLTIIMYNRGDATENIRNPTNISCEPRPYFYIDKAGKLKEDDAVLKYYGSHLQPDPFWDFLRSHSRIYNVLNQANLNLSLHEPLYRKLRGWLLSPFTSRVPKITAAQAPYRPQDAAAVTGALMMRLNNDCRQLGGKLMVVDFPNIVKDPEFGKQIDGLNKLSAKKGFACFDLTPIFRWNPDPMSLFVQYHFSVKGHKLVAERINDYLNSNHLAGTVNR